MATETITTEGFDDFQKLLIQLGEEFGYTEVNKRVLIPAVRDAMQGMVSQAQSLARVDTGQMRASIKVDARRPNAKDKQSKYILKDDAAIAILSVKRSKASLSEEFGDAKKPGHPFLRPTFESNISNMTRNLSETIASRLNKYQAKKSKDKKL